MKRERYGEICQHFMMQMMGFHKREPHFTEETVLLFRKMHSLYCLHFDHILSIILMHDTSYYLRNNCISPLRYNYDLKH